MPEVDQAVLIQISGSANLRYDMEILRGCGPVEARRLAMITTEYITQSLDGPERMRVLLHVTHVLLQRT